MKRFILFFSLMCSFHLFANLSPKENLGKTLFFDPILSGSNMISCASCHNPSLGWSDGLPLAVGHGHQVLGRRTPTIINAKDQWSYFWDGRAETLEEQALGPILSPGEMNQDMDELIEELSAIKGYLALFNSIFPSRGVSSETIAEAIASYERTIVKGETPYDRYLKGDDQAISESAKRGFKIFAGHKGKCFHCHNTTNLADGRFWDIGIDGDDLGLGELPENRGNENTHFRFKTPTLWGIADRSPYMHNGIYKTLEEVVEHYNRGGALIDQNGSYKRRRNMPHFVRPLNLSKDDKRNLVAFMRSLSFPIRPVELPILPRGK